MWVVGIEEKSNPFIAEICCMAITQLCHAIMQRCCRMNKGLREVIDDTVRSLKVDCCVVQLVLWCQLWLYAMSLQWRSSVRVLANTSATHNVFRRTYFRRSSQNSRSLDFKFTFLTEHAYHFGSFVFVCLSKPRTSTKKKRTPKH